MIRNSIIAGIVGVLSVGSSIADVEPAAIKIHITVLDQENKPVSNASCKIGFDAPPETSQTEGSLIVRGTTDTDGTFFVDGKTRLSVYCTVTKLGYYKTYEQHEFDQAKILNAYGIGKPLSEWQSEPLEMKIVLRRFIDPIPMYAKHVEIKIAKDGELLGFDLMEGDWVAPYGKGKTADFVFTSQRAITGPKQWKAGLSLTFPNQDDGIQDAFASFDHGSDLRLPHQAPVDGYKSNWSQTSSSTQYANSRADQNYYFRVRTAQDDKGSVKSALYGKIYGDIGYYVGVKAPQAGLGFTYYLNPIANDPNVEFDPKKNLFHGLSESERVTKP